MKANRLILILALVLLASLLSACGGAPVASSWPGLAADQEAAYLANGAIVYAIRLKDGEEIWRFPESPSSKLAFYSNPVFTSDGQLLLGSSGAEHTLFSVDAETGKDTWSFTEANDQWVASPLVVGEMVYAPNADGTLYVFNMAQEGNDKLAWKVELGGKLWSQPVTDGTRVYVASLDHHLHAVDMATHSVMWVADLGGAVSGVPALDEGQIFIGSFDPALTAINTADGSITWTASTESWVWGGPALDGETLYFGDLDGNFYTVNAADGAVLDSSKPDGPILATPIVLNGQVFFVTENGTVYSFMPGANPQSMEKLDGKLYTAPVAAGDLILVAPFQGEFLLVALNADGKVVWSFTSEK